MAFSKFEKIASIEGTPHSAEVFYRHEGREPITDFKVIVRPPVKVSERFWEVYAGKDSFTEVTEEASTPDFTYYEMTVDYRKSDSDLSEEATRTSRVAVGVNTISDLIESINEITNGDIT